MLTQESALRKDTTTRADLQHRHFAFIAQTIKAMPGHAPSLRAQSVALAFADACLWRGGAIMTTREITNSDDVIDSRDVIERIEELHAITTDEEADANDRTHANNELSVLQALQEEAEGYAPDWKHGACLIRHTYWVEYAEDMLKDIGDLPRDLPGYLVIDWEATAQNLLVDYTTVSFDGVDYYVR